MSKDKEFFAGLAPRPPAQPEVVAAIDKAAEGLGFVSREAVPAMPLRRKRTEEPTFSFTARVSIRSGNAFIAWCEEERMTYRQGFDRLVELLERSKARA